MSVSGGCGVDDGREHIPAFVLPGSVAGDAVHVPDGLDGFGSIPKKLVHIRVFDNGRGGEGGER